MKTVKIDGQDWNAEWVAGHKTFEAFCKTNSAKVSYANVSEEAKAEILAKVYELSGGKLKAEKVKTEETEEKPKKAKPDKDAK